MEVEPSSSSLRDGGCLTDPWGIGVRRAWPGSRDIVGRAADPYHRIDIRSTSRQLVVGAHGLDRGLDVDEILRDSLV
jgi:hypothetical protein